MTGRPLSLLMFLALSILLIIILAVSVPFGFHEAREFYGPTVDGVRQLPNLAPGVAAVIIGWVVLTLVILAGWVWMLWRVQSPTARSLPQDQTDYL